MRHRIMSDLALNDPVHVERDSQQLEGLIAYIGPVQFSDSSDWVGVRLTGASVGLGKNDGSVKGERYFQCGPNNGVFVRSSNLTKRTLTRLEELRLKRELAKVNAGIAAGVAPPFIPSASHSVATPRKISATKKSDETPRPPPSTTKTMSKPLAVPATTSQKSKLEELRERRAALEAAKTLATQLADTTRPPSPTAPDIVSHDEDNPVDLKISSLHGQLKDVQEQLSETLERLKVKEEENSSLQQILSKVEQDLHDAFKKVEEVSSAIPPPLVTGTLDASLQDEVAQATDALHLLQQQCRVQCDELDQAKVELSSYKLDLERERGGRASDIRDLTKTKSELSVLQNVVQAMSDQNTVRSTSDATHYKERAKLQTELGAMKRTIEELETEKAEMEGDIEELTLDKEQLEAENEGLQDKLDELKIDAETAQMEVEELRLELNDVNGRNSNLNSYNQMTSSPDVDNAMQSLSSQNGRLREALIRLREQSSIEKMDMSKELRAAEKLAIEGSGLTSEVENLRSTTKVLQSQIADLKDVVEESSAFESMVEDLSDRVMALEDENVSLQSTIRELEEAADIAAEMEEVYADENKSVLRDIESRDAIIRNLEEAIRMQRRREEDFQRTVGNYRNTVDTLKQERNQLLALQRGGEGEKSNLLATSQKALARAAHLVSDAANARKREVTAAFVQVECQLQRHLAERLESFLPPGMVGSELAAVHGELALSSVIYKASKVLEEMEIYFLQATRVAINEVISESSEKGDIQSFYLSDDAAQGIEIMIHQSEYAISTISASSKLIRFLVAGQWPDLLTTNDSAELGAILGHSLGDIDSAMITTLKLLKEEGVLLPHRSHLGAFQQCIQTTLQALDSSIDREGQPLFSGDWNPPALYLFKNVVTAKFLCLGAASVVACAISPEDSSLPSDLSAPVVTHCNRALKGLMIRLDEITGEACKIGPRLARLNVSNNKIIKEFEEVATEWVSASQMLLDNIKAIFSAKTVFNVATLIHCETASDVVIKALSQFSTSLRVADLNADVDAGAHPFSSEAKDPWSGITCLAQSVRAIDGDREDVHFIVRAQKTEQKFAEAIENEPKLDAATLKITSLEKSLLSRTKEIAMQNARISELEKVMTKSSINKIPIAKKSVDVSSVEEIGNLKEENRVLTEAIDVLQHQVDEYEYEIRSVKDPKSPKPRGVTTPRRVTTSMFSSGRSTRGSEDISGGADTSPASVAAFEAVLYRPILASTRRETSHWKAIAMSSTFLDLPSLSFPNGSSLFRESKEDDNPFAMLDAARTALRFAKASTSIVDLTTPSKRALYFHAMTKTANAEVTLKDAIKQAQPFIANLNTASFPLGTDTLLGRVKFPDLTESTTISVTVDKEGICRLQRLMIK